jgi:hypothetical protein
MIAALALALPGLAQLQPASHESPSGLWRLRVDPVERTGASGADYAMTLDGTPVWEARHPFTLWEACVTDQGRVGGVAYVGQGAESWGGGRLDVVILAPANAGGSRAASRRRKLGKATDVHWKQQQMKEEHWHEIFAVAIGNERQIARYCHIAQAPHRAHAECGENEAGGQIADCVGASHAYAPPRPDWPRPFTRFRCAATADMRLSPTLIVPYRDLM